MRNAYFFLIILVSSILIEGIEIKRKERKGRKPFKERVELLRTRVKRWHCHGPYGGGGGGFGGGGGGGFGGGGRGGFGGGGLGGGLLGGLGDMDPTTMVLLALMSGMGGGAVAPVTGIGGGIAPLPPSLPLKTNTPDPVAKSVDELTEELPASSKAGGGGAEAGQKAGGYVTPGNRCADSNECVANAECVEALRQKYCVCSHGRRPKGGLCI